MPTNRELVEASFAAFQRGDLEGMFVNADPSLEFDNETGAPGVTGLWHGRDGFVEMLGKVTEAFSEYGVEPLAAEESGEQVRYRMREFATGRSSGIEIDRILILDYTLREGRIVRIHATVEGEAAPGAV